MDGQCSIFFGFYRKLSKQMNKINLSENNVEHKLLESRCCEFPTLNPNNVGKAYRYLFIGAADKPSGNAPLQAILKIDLHTGKRQTFSVAPRGFAG